MLNKIVEDFWFSVPLHIVYSNVYKIAKVFKFGTVFHSPAILLLLEFPINHHIFHFTKSYAYD